MSSEKNALKNLRAIIEQQNELRKHLDQYLTGDQRFSRLTEEVENFVHGSIPGNIKNQMKEWVEISSTAGSLAQAEAQKIGNASNWLSNVNKAFSANSSILEAFSTYSNYGKELSDLTKFQRRVVDAIRVDTIGKSGAITAELKQVGKLPSEERAKKAKSLNRTKEEVTSRLAQIEEELKEIELQNRIETERVDVTLPLPKAPMAKGRIHPVSQVLDELTAIFSDMGFSIAEGPDIETDYYNFTALNFPEGHPAREMHDTFFLKPDAEGNRKLLRTHTSPVQIRSMLRTNEGAPAPWVSTAVEPPIRIIAPGRTYRHDSDQTHTPMFHQVEGLVIDKSSHIGQLRWVLETSLAAFFEVDHVTTRFRPSFFPFTEPSMEVDVQCDRSGSEIRIGEGNDWLEILGCGMVHPNVLRNCGLDPDVYQGFAWGMGIDRIAMLKYGMPDLRAFFDADQRWIDHYGFRPLDLPTLFGGLAS